VAHHIDEPLLLLLSFLRLYRSSLLGELSLLDFGDVHNSGDEAGIRLVAEGSEEKQSPFALFARGANGTPEFTSQFLAARKGLAVGSHDVLVVVRVDALWPGTELVLDLVGGQLEEAVVDKHGLGL